jgi:HSP20 family protein
LYAGLLSGIEESCAPAAEGHSSLAFSLPEGVDASGVQAERKSGVLTLTVPKVPEVQPRKIQVQVQ